jgi:cysteine desulfuration protein SufE
MSSQPIEQRIEKLKSDFKNFGEWEARYKHLIELGKKMPPMNEDFKTEDNKVKGCQTVMLPL